MGQEASLGRRGVGLDAAMGPHGALRGKGVSLPTNPKGLGWAEPGLSSGWGRGSGGPSPNGCIPYECALNICVGVLVCMG